MYKHISETQNWDVVIQNQEITKSMIIELFQYLNAPDMSIKILTSQ